MVPRWLPFFFHIASCPWSALLLPSSFLISNRVTASWIAALFLERLQLPWGDQVCQGIGGAAATAQLAIFPPQSHTTQGRQVYQERAEPIPTEPQVLWLFCSIFFPSTCSVSVLHCLACMFRIPCHQNDILLLRCSADLLCHSCFLVEKDSDLAQLCIFGCLPDR